MPSDTGDDRGAGASDAARDRVFLVVVDDSPEREVASNTPACAPARAAAGSRCCG
jgi:hypothetical protein